MDSEIYYWNSTEHVIHFGNMNEDGFLNRVEKTINFHFIPIENTKFKKETMDIFYSEQSSLMKIWTNTACNDYDFLLSYCCLFTRHKFDTLADRIVICNRKKTKKSSRWGIGKRIYTLFRNAGINLDIVDKIDKLE